MDPSDLARLPETTDNPYTTPFQPLSLSSNGENGFFGAAFNSDSSGLPSSPLNGFSYSEVTSTGVTHYVNTMSYDSKTVKRNNNTFEEMIVDSVCYTKKIQFDGTVLENESKLKVHSVMDAEGNLVCHWTDDDNHQGTKDYRGETDSGENHFSSNDRLVEETQYRKFFITYEPQQFAVDDIDFEYMEDYLEFEMYDLAINFPEQKDVLCSQNFQKVMDKILPFAEEQGRLEDVDMLAVSHVYDYNLNVRRGKASASEMMQLAGLTNTPQLCLEYTATDQGEEEALDSSYGLKELFLTPSSSLSDISEIAYAFQEEEETIPSTSDSSYGLKELFLTQSSSLGDISEIEYDDASSTNSYLSEHMFETPRQNESSELEEQKNTPLPTINSSYSLKDLFVSASESDIIKIAYEETNSINSEESENMFGFTRSESSGFHLFDNDPYPAEIVSTVPIAATAVCEDIAVVVAESEDAVDQLSACDAELAVPIKDTYDSRTVDTNIDVQSINSESTSLEENKGQVDDVIPRRSKPSRLRRVRRFLRRFNVFSGAICSKIVRSFVQNYPVM